MSDVPSDKLRLLHGGRYGEPPAPKRWIPKTVWTPGDEWLAKRKAERERLAATTSEKGTAS